MIHLFKYSKIFVISNLFSLNLQVDMLRKSGWIEKIHLETFQFPES